MEFQLKKGLTKIYIYIYIYKLVARLNCGFLKKKRDYFNVKDLLFLTLL